MQAMTRKANEHLAKLESGSENQNQSAKALGLILWFFTTVATSPASQVAMMHRIERAWDAILIHLELYLNAPSIQLQNDTLKMMGLYLKGGK